MVAQAQWTAGGSYCANHGRRRQTTEQQDSTREHHRAATILAELGRSSGRTCALRTPCDAYGGLMGVGRWGDAPLRAHRAQGGDAALEARSRPLRGNLSREGGLGGLPRAAATTSGASSRPGICAGPDKRQHWVGSPQTQQLATPQMNYLSAPRPICRPRPPRRAARALDLFSWTP